MTAPSRRYADVARDQLRAAILDSAAALIRERGWATTRMADVAERTGISRQTLYLQMGSRDALGAALVLREVEQFLDTIGDTVAENAGHAPTAIEAAFTVFLASAADNPLLLALVTDNANEPLLAHLTTHGAPILRVARARMTELITTTWARMDPGDALLLADHIIRLAISAVTLPDDEQVFTPAGAARVLGSFATGIATRLPSSTARRPDG